jgi:hypothetical protein
MPAPRVAELGVVRRLSAFPVNPTIPLLACSGPDVQSTIATSIRISYYNAALLALVLAVGVVWQIICRRRGRWHFVLFHVALGIALLWWHPAWTMDPYKGDCGYGMVFCSFLFSAVAFYLFTFEFRASRNQPKVA